MIGVGAGRAVDDDADRPGRRRVLAARRAGEVEVAPGSTPVPVRSLTVMVSAPPRALKLTLLDAVEVHGDVADVAEQPRPRLPLAEMSMFSLALEPLNSSVSVPALALDDVAAVAGVPHERVVAGAQEGDVVAAAADDRCRCRRRRSATSSPSLPVIVSLPAPPSTVSSIHAGRQGRRR